MRRVAYIGPIGGLRGGGILANNLIRATTGRVAWSLFSHPNQVETSKFDAIYTLSGQFAKLTSNRGLTPVIWHILEQPQDLHLSKHAKKIIVLNQSVFDHCVGFQNQVTILENPVFDGFGPGLKQEDLKRNTPVLMYCGVLSYSKGTELLLQSVDEIECELWLIGRDIRPPLIRQSHPKNVVFWGERKDVVRFYRSADMFILPSYSEGMSHSLLEAMACGLPCIASNIEANRATLLDAGIYCELNVESIKQSIIHMIDSPNKGFYGSRAIEIAQTRKFGSWVERMLGIIEQTCLSS